MTQRTIRVNELIKREISHLLHTRYQGENTLTTILEVDTSPDLKRAIVYYSVLGEEAERRTAERFFRRRGYEIQSLVAKVVILKNFPQLEFAYDESMVRGAEVNRILDELEISPEEPKEEHDG